MGDAAVAAGWRVVTCCARRASRVAISRRSVVWATRPPGLYMGPWASTVLLASSAMLCDVFRYFAHLIADLCGLVLAWVRHWKGGGVVHRCHGDRDVVGVVVTMLSWWSEKVQVASKCEVKWEARVQGCKCWCWCWVSTGGEAGEHLGAWTGQANLLQCPYGCMLDWPLSLSPTNHFQLDLVKKSPIRLPFQAG